MQLPFLKKSGQGQTPSQAPSQSPDPEEGRALRRRELQERYQPTETERKQVGLVQRRFQLAKEAKHPHYQGWATSLAFYTGEQWGSWNETSRQLVLTEELEPWRKRLTDNQVTQIALTVAAKLAKTRHLTAGQPNNPEELEDVLAAEMATDVLRHLDRVTQRQKRRRKLELLKVIYGTAFLSPYWDPSARSEVAVQDPLTGSVRGKEAFVGEQRIEVLSVWEVFPEPVDDWEDVSWCVKAKWRTLDWIIRTFPQKGLLVQGQSQGEELFLSLLEDAKSPGGKRPGELGREEGALVLEYFERPCPDYPEGRYLIVCGDVLLHQEQALPHPKRRFPFIPQFGIEVPGRLWGMGWIEQVVGQQRYLNAVESDIAEAQTLTAHPKWKCPREARLDEEAMTNEPGEIVFYDAQGGTGPEPMIPPQIPQYVAELPDKLIERIRIVAGANEASMGQVPQGVKSGVAIDLLKEADDSRLSLSTDAAADAWVELDQQMLESVAARYTVPRFVKVFGEDAEGKVFSFLGSDLYGNTEVRLEANEAVSESIAAVRQRILDYRAAGFFDLPAQLVVRLFRIMGEQQLAQAVDQVAQQAEAEQAQQMAQMAQMGGIDPAQMGADPNAFPAEPAGMEQFAPTPLAA